MDGPDPATPPLPTYDDPVKAARLAAALADIEAGGQGAEDGLAALRTLAEGGFAPAQFSFGLHWARGQGGLAVDLRQAEHWCRAAARQGHPLAQYNLGLLHVDRDTDEAIRWLRLAAINEVDEAEACLDLVYRQDDRPRTWDEAETRASVALARSDAETGKRMRLADYYVDPCLDLLERGYRMRREQAEEIVQEFFLELEEPLSKGQHQGRRWKDVLRERYRSEQGQFRPFLRRALVNFARDWLRQRRPRTAEATAEAARTLADEATALAHEWRPMLERFLADATSVRPEFARPLAALRLLLVDSLTQIKLSAHLGISGRTLRKDLRLAAEILHDWLAGQLAALGPSGRTTEGLRRGLDLLPEWLHFPSADKRAKVLLLLALLARVRPDSRQRQAPAQGR